MEPNHNIPTEREWTTEEREEFYAMAGLTDLFTRMGILKGATASNAPVLPQVGIHITHIVPPAQGWPVAIYCPICRETTFVLSAYAAKPEDGDYWKMNESCVRDGVCDQHNIKMATKPFAYRALPGGYVDATGPHRGVPPTQEEYAFHRLLYGPYDAIFKQEMTIEEAKKRFPNTPIPKK